MTTPTTPNEPPQPSQTPETPASVTPASDASAPLPEGSLPAAGLRSPAEGSLPAAGLPSSVLALPAPTAADQRRVLALTEAGVPLTRAFARLVQTLRDQGHEVVPLALPRAEPPPESVPTITELKRGIQSFAKDVLRGLRGAPQTTQEPWVVSQLRAVQGSSSRGGAAGGTDAVIATDAEVARLAFPYVDQVFPGAVRIGCDVDYHIDNEWKAVELDALVVSHPALGGDLPRVREGRARTFIGGPIAAGEEIVHRRLGEELPQVVVSFARLDPGDVDPLLFQLSLAKPERFSLLFLPSQRPGVDELVRARAGTYGLRGKRPKADAETEGWIRGASLLVGFPSPAECATAVAAGVPLLFVAAESRLNEGDRFLAQRGALVSDVPLTIAVHVEGLLPGGAYRARAEAAWRELEPTGTSGAVQAILAAVKAGRPTPPVGAVEVGGAAAASAGAKADDDLEDIGGPSVTASQAGAAAWSGASPSSGGAIPSDLPLPVRRAYLTEIILQHQAIDRNLMRAKAGLETWQKRVRLARTAGQDVLADRAVPRVEGLLKVIDQLEREVREVKALRERFASSAPLSAADRAAAARYMSPSTAASIDRSEAPDSAFTQLEIEDALAVLKRKLEGR